MKRRFLFLLTLGFITSHGGFSGVESAKATQVSQAQECTIRVSNVRELVEAFDIASKNGQDDVICIQAGTYSIGIDKPLVYNLTNRLSECGKKLTVRAEGRVVIQAKEKLVMGILISPTILEISTRACGDDKGSDITIQGIIFLNGFLGVKIKTTHANVSLINNIFEDNQLAGASVSTSTGSLYFENNIFRNNRVRGAIVSTSTGPLYFENNEFINNQEGGLKASTGAGSVNLKNNKFRDNVERAPGLNGGGGALVTAGSGVINITNNVFSNNIARYNGGGLKVESEEGLINLVGNVFVNNRVHGEKVGLGGGAYVYTYYGTINLINNVFNSNVSECQSCSGGGLIVRRYGGIDVRRRAGSVTLIGNTFINNRATSIGGGAYFLSEFEEVTLVNNVFYRNTSSYSGGVSAEGRKITFVNNTFVMNQSDNFGGGVHISTRSQASAYIYNNIFWNNISKNDGHEIYVSNDPKDTIVIAHNLFTPSTNPIDFSRPQHPKVFVKSLGLYNKDIPKGCSTSGSFGNIQADPMFVNPEKEDFRLRVVSPAINSGCNSAPSIPETDKDGNQRIWDGIVDMGAYEHGPWPAPK